MPLGRNDISSGVGKKKITTTLQSCFGTVPIALRLCNWSHTFARSAGCGCMCSMCLEKSDLNLHPKSACMHLQQRSPHSSHQFPECESYSAFLGSTFHLQIFLGPSWRPINLWNWWNMHSVGPICDIGVTFFFPAAAAAGRHEIITDWQLRNENP